ncbi:MAG: DUF1902 domain-containing protein [Defluviicoccus sp.]|nr:DUF1902 domain-containing protein [Defluviicoccus sp.]MDE0382459.1 DUF1902 domain-containing protein [Defluviicoccus sp.]
MENSYSVQVFQCEESGAYVGTSEDIPGLTLESESLGGLLEAVMEMVPQLIEHNLGVPKDADVQVLVRVRAPSKSGSEASRRRVQSSSAPRPRYVVEEEPGLSYA